MKGYPDRNCVKSIIVGILLLLCGRFLMAQSYLIGDLYTAADGSQGIVYYIHPDGSGGWVVALNDASTACAWGAYGDVPDLENYNPGTYFQQLLYDTAGYANTRSIRNYQNNNSYAAGVVDFENGWVLPSLMQLRMLYGQLPYITSALLSAGGTTLANDWYWSSTEMHYRDAWCIFFGSNNSVAGGFSYFQKNYNYRVRAVRSFAYTTENADVTAGMSCSWSTGDTTSSIVVTPTQTTTYSVIVSTVDGCSDTVEHTIVVNTADPEEITQTACESYEWNGQIYTESGEYTQTFTAANGCDSVVTLQLTIFPEESLPDNVFDGDCVLPPDSNAFTMVELFKCPNVNSMSTPMVADMDGDGLPEIIACCYTSSAPYYNTGFYVVNGQTGALKYTLNTVQYSNSGLMATIADVDHDGKSELFLLGADHRLYCYNYNGGVRWSSANTIANNYLLSAADVNNDGVAEIVCGEYVYDAQTGVLLLHGAMVETGMGFGAPHGVHLPYFHIPYYMYALGDVDGDETLELCAGNTIYKMVITNNAGTTGNSWSILRQAETPGVTNKDGQTFLVDFDKDGDFDVCVIGITHSLTQNTSSHTLDVYVWDGQTSQMIAHSQLFVRNKCGASIPYSGDLNGDGYPEIIFNSPPGMMAYTYDTVSSSMSLMHSYAPFSETAGFTVFDFNQDGRNEIVYRGATQLYIVDGVTLENLCPPITAYSGTITEYPIVADVNADGQAEIIVARAYNNWNSGGGANGWVSVYGSQIPGAWSSARKVWNQWAYSSVNINEDMTVPQYRFNVATTFPNGEKPFNGFLRQMPYIDPQGNLFNPVADVVITGASASSQEDTVILSINCCNNGDMPLLPYPVTVYANTYGGDIITTVTIAESLPVDSCVQLEIRMPKSQLCDIQGLEALVVAVNSSGSGIAQNGGLQSECDTTNNGFTIPFHLRHVDPVELTVINCGSYEWHGQTYTWSGDYSVVYPNSGGCDSIEILHLTVYPKPETIINATSDTICEGEEVTLQAQLLNVDAFLPNMVAIGDILCTDGSIVKPSAWPVNGKTVMGIVYYVDNTGEHGWAVHLHDQGTGLRWSTSGLDIIALTNYYNIVRNAIMDVDGYFNTQEIRASGNAEMFPVAYAVDFDNGWYVPALGQFRLLLAEVVTINNSLQLVNGTPFDMNTNWGYWSSTEGDGGGAWNMYHYGGMFPTSKTVLHRVRSIRNF